MPGKRINNPRFCGNPETGGSDFQSVRFSRHEGGPDGTGWTPSSARHWAHEAGFEAPASDVTTNQIRLRQKPPNTACGFATMPIATEHYDGISAVVEFPHKRLTRAMRQAMVEAELRRRRR